MAEGKMKSWVEDERVLVLERVFEAPRALVFSMYSEAEHLRHWWGPRGWEVPVCKFDLRPGGVWHYCMKCVDKNQGKFFGMESWGKGIYKEVVVPERIVYTDYFSDADGNVNDAMPSTEVTLTFLDMGAQTKVICRSQYVSAEALKTVMDMGMLAGITQTWDRLEERLAELHKA
jgi:uncharacterized protein YndB with AHSA1/START domain